MEKPALVVRDPVLLSLFLHGYEDLTWGRDQLVIAMVIHDLGAKIANEEMRREIQSSAARLMVHSAQDMVKASQSGDTSI